jgi:G3E family GTPase
LCLQVEADFLADLKQRLRRVNALAPITHTQRAKVPLDDLLGLRGFELETVEGVVSQNPILQRNVVRIISMYISITAVHFKIV